MIRKTFKYRLYPNKIQREQLERYFGACRWVYNWGIEQKSRAYKEDKKNVSIYDLMNNMAKLKRTTEFEWLNNPPAQCLQQSLKNLEKAYTKFFRKQTGYPNFKSKKQTSASCQFPQAVKVNFQYHKIKFHKLGSMNIRIHKVFDGKIKTVVIKKTSSGKYFAFAYVETNNDEPTLKLLDESRAIGVDLGIRRLITTSDGDKFENHKYLTKSSKKLLLAHKRYDRKKRGSKNKNKQRIKLARLFEKITNQRHDNLHKISRQLVNENQIDTFCLETLDIENMIRDLCNKNGVTNILDASWGWFVRFLKYKAQWAGKNILRIGRFDPSSKMCSKCGYINHSLGSQISWVCPECETKHDRDINAAINIRDFAFHPQRLLEFKLKDLGKKVGQEVSELHRKMKAPAEKSHGKKGIRRGRNGRKAQLHSTYMPNS
jgi:putative transposase